MYFSGFDVGQKLSIADVRRSKDKPSVLLRVNAKKSVNLRPFLLLVKIIGL